MRGPRFKGGLEQSQQPASVTHFPARPHGEIRRNCYPGFLDRAAWALTIVPTTCAAPAAADVAILAYRLVVDADF